MTNEHDDFWGDQAEWSGEHRRVAPARRGLGDTLRGWWSSALDAGTTATRHHGAVGGGTSAPPADPDLDDWTPAATSAAALDIDEWTPTTARAAALDIDEWTPTAASAAALDLEEFPTTDVADTTAVPATAAWDADWEAVERPVGVDPLLARLGTLAIAVTLLIPIFLGLRSGGGDDGSIESAALDPATTAPLVVAEPASTEEPATSTAATPADPAPSPTPAADVATTAAVATAAAPAEPATTATATAAAEPVSVSAEVQTTTAGLDESASADDPAERVVPACAIEYEIVAGDFWIRLADASGVDLADLLAANGATARTPLFPGATICLPAGATTPAPPATAPPTTAPPTTAPPTTAPPTTAPPTTAPPATAPPATAPPATAPPATSPPGPEVVKQIIRDVWPDELEEKALDVAYRESRFDPRADNNFCCYGVFQIYWTVHRGWLDDLGITSVEHLFDAEANTRAAYELYQRAGGWGPWGG